MIARDASRRRGPRHHGLVHANALAALLAIGITGCTSPPGPSATAPGPSVTASSTPRALEAPTPVVDLICDDLLGGPLFTEAFGMPLQLAATELPSRLIPISYGLRALGGLQCEWNTGTALDFDGAGVRVRVLPEAESAWARFAEYPGSVVGWRCFSQSERCETNELVDSLWIEVTVISPNSEASAKAMAASIIAAFTALETPPRSPSPPIDGALPQTCPEIVSDSEVAAALGLSEPIESVGGSEFDWPMESVILTRLGGPRCVWGPDPRGEQVAWLSSIPGGTWAWEEVRAALPADERPEPITALASDGVDGWVRCGTDGTCRADLIIGRSWIEIGVLEGTDPDGRTRVEALASAVAATLATTSP